jgi:enoyl-CoA hydratase/carnithine racemase
VQFETVRVELDGPIAVVELHRPERRNAWTLTLAAELGEALHGLDGNDSVRAVVLTGAGNVFSVGADLDAGSIDAPGGTDYDDRPRPQRSPREMCKPVIAALNGHAVGIGMTYPLLCDLRFVAEDARVGLPFVRRGVIPELNAHWILVRLVGLSLASDLILTGRTISGREAAEVGLCSRALPAAEVLPVAIDTARDIATNVAPASVAASKRLLWDGLTASFEDAAARERELFQWLAQEDDAREGVASFLDKRPPRWSLPPSARPERAPGGTSAD